MSDVNWNRNDIQFPRLLCEIIANWEPNKDEWKALCESMDLTEDDIVEIFQRAQWEWDIVKEQSLTPVRQAALLPESRDGPMYRTRIEIWTDFDPHGLDLSDLAREAEEGSGLCTCIWRDVIFSEAPGVTDHDLFVQNNEDLSDDV